uniref:3-phosphoinositide-dependent protein kinase-1 n=1 Tax=Davidia involucrata TaxID=16924 RepID=A0A5B7AIW6_DAVIN
MAISVSNREIWEEIERSESYLVCCMFEEAASLASSVLRALCDNKRTDGGLDIELIDMLESAGMVLVQSLKELGRTLEILNELKLFFGSVSAIPVQVFLTGVCFQITEGPSGVQEFLEEFLSKWRYLDEQYYVLATAESNVANVKECDSRFMLGVDKYLEVVEVYVVMLLGMVLGKMDHAISWVEKAALPEEKRQGLLRRLLSLNSSKITSSSQGSVSSLLAGEHGNCSSSLKEPDISEGSPKALKAQYPSNGDNDKKQAILKLSGQRVPCFWWFRTITLKFGNGQSVISNGNIVLACLVFLMYYLLRRKRASLKRILRRQAFLVKKALVDLWHLAFSYQVNPLAAVQPLPAATHGSR